jgi:hypothetical protein
MEKIKVNIGQNQYVVDTMLYTYQRVVDLAEKIADIRRNHSLFAKYPLEENETREKWKERIEPLMEKDLIRKEGESEGDHLKRLFEAMVDTHEMAFEILGAIAETFRLNPVAQEDFRSANWIKVREFIFNVLHLGDIPADDFYPKKTTS